jgi:hypothetical protein
LPDALDFAAELIDFELGLLALGAKLLLKRKRAVDAVHVRFGRACERQPFGLSP